MATTNVAVDDGLLAKAQRAAKNKRQEDLSNANIVRLALVQYCREGGVLPSSTSDEVQMNYGLNKDAGRS